ncbi:MAG TPA: immunoglobulin domain-containing protein [Candidatus Sulfotelmatobacter sp.]|nr:immunoglobulin domain-containing protein [Candidatus Sulfotelmatobacter sp.]
MLNPSNAITNTAGNPFYLWFNFIDANQLPIADASYQRVIPVQSSIPSGTLFPIGTTTVTNTAADDCGNTTNTTFAVTITDTEAPSLILTNPVTVTLVDGNYNLSPTDVSNLVAGSTDPCGITNVAVTPNSFSCGNVGPNPVTVVMTDLHGNSTTGTGTITVQDLTAPTLVLTNAVTVTLASNGSYTLSQSDISTLTAGSSDPCGITGTNVTPNSFDCANVGPNTVTVILTDSHNNSTTNTATITVADTTPPMIVPHTIPVTLGADGTYTLTASDEAALVAGSSDSCGIQSTNFSATTFDYCQAGLSVPVTVTLTDVHGVSSNATASVTVNAPTNAPQMVYVDASYANNECNVTFPNVGGSGSYYYGYNAFSTIQAGLNAVAPGGTVTVAPGTYNESPTINSPVALTSIGGTNAAGTVINLPEEPSPNYAWAALIINASSVSVEGFTIVGYDSAATNTGPTSGYSSDDIFLDAQLSNPPAVTNIDIGNNILEVGAVNLSFDTGPSSGYGISSEMPAFLDSTNTLGNYDPGTSPPGPLDSLTVHNNIFEPVDVPSGPNTIGSAFFINPAANFTFVSNTITGGLGMSQTSATNSLIAYNTVIGVSTNDNSGGFGTFGYPDPDFYGANAVIRDNIISNVATAVGIFDSEKVTVENNVLNGNGVGVTVQDTGNDPVYPAGNTVQIINNNLADNVTGIVNTSSNSIPVASSNWWGSVSGPAGAQNPYGTGSPVTGNVTIDSWLQSGANANTGIGFTPTAGEEYPPTQLVFTTEPVGADLGNLLSTEPVVSVEDAYGNITPWVDASVSIAISNNPASGVLVGTTNEATVNGVATFTDLYVTNDGGSGYTLIATATGLTPAVSSPFDITNPAPEITSISPFYMLAGVNVNGMTLTVNGTNFVADSVVDWDNQALPTTFVSGTQLTATVPAPDVAAVGTALVTVVSPAAGGGTSAGFTFYIEPAQPTVVYVDTNYSRLATNAWVNWPYNGSSPSTNIVGYDAFATIQAGVNAVAPGGMVNVAAGTYPEEVTVAEPMTLLGPNAANNPNTSTRVAEAVIEPDVNGPEMLNYPGGIPDYNPPYNPAAVNVMIIETNNVSIKGFTVSGYNPTLPSPWQAASDYFNAAVGIGDYNGDSYITIENNIIENDAYSGLDFESDGNGNPPNTNSCIKYNLFQNIDYNTEGFGQALILNYNYYAEICSNSFTNVCIGIAPGNFFLPNPGSPSGQIIAGNQVSASLLGIWLNNVFQSASTFEIVGNTSIFMPTNGSTLYGPPEWDGYEITSIQNAVGVVASNNVAIGPSASPGYNAVGYNVWNTPTTGPVLITGGSVSNVTYGVWVNNFDGYQSPGGSTTATVSNLTVNVATGAGVYVQDDPRASTNGVLVQATVTGGTVITGGGSGVLVQGTNAAASVINGPSISGNAVGIAVDTGKALIQGNDLMGNSVAGISVTNNAIVDAGDCSGNDVTRLGTGSNEHGSSQGLNNLSDYAFDGAAPWAIQSANTMPQTVLAENDNFGATNESQNIASDISDPNGTVEYSQGSVLIAGPANVTVICADSVPVGATTLTQFMEQGGYISGNNSTISFSDSYSTNFEDATTNYVDGTNVITITRTYTISNPCGSQSVPQTITLDETPPVVTVSTNIVQTNDLGACGAVVNFTAPAASDICGISGSPSVSSPSGSSFPVGTTPVIVVATDNNGLSTTNSFTVTVIDTEPPAITNAVNIVTAVDAGQNYATVNFSIGATDNCAVASMLANWEANTQSAQGNVVTVSGWEFPIGTNTVTVTATDVNSNMTTATFTVAVIGLPQITSQPQSLTNNAGTTAQFTVGAYSPAGLTYQWFKKSSPLSNGGNISGATSATLSVTSVSNSDEATYYVQVSNFAGMVTSSNVTLTVIDPPIITSISPVNATNNATTTAQFTVSATGTLPFAYQWTKVTATSTNVLSDAGNISGSTSNVLTISNVLAADQAEYVVTVSNSAGTDTTNALLFVNDPVIVVQPVSVTNSLGGSATFSVTAAGTQPLSYQWLQDGVGLPGATGSTLTLNSIDDSSAGDYTVVVSNSVGEVTSDTVTLTVTHPPVITSQPASLTENLGQTATFTVAANGDTPFTYQWYQNGSPLSDVGNISGSRTRQLVITSVTTADAASYYVAITNDVGQTNSMAVTLTVIVPPAITNQPVGLTNNAGTTASFAVGASGTAPAFQWYQITATATNPLTDGGNIFGATSNVLTITNVLGADDGYYMVLATNRAGTAASSNAILVVIDPIITSEPSSVTTNLGSPASFSVAAYGTSPKYQWYFNGNAIPGANASTYSIASVVDANAGNYTVVVSNIFGVVTSTPAASLTVIDPPVITGQPQNVTANAGGAATFTVAYTGTSPTFQWYFGNQPLNNSTTVTGANGPTLTLTDVTDANGGAYSVVVENSITSVTSSNAILTVIDPPVITSLQPPIQTNNATTTAQFAVNVTGTAPFTYQWIKITPTLTNVLADGGNISGSTSNVLTITNVLAADQAEYLVTVSNPAGTVTNDGMLFVIDPAIFVQPIGQTNFTGSTVTFSVTAAGTSPLSYQWFQNGSPLFGANSNVLTLTHLADSDAGAYTVVISNSVGSVTSSQAVLVTVSPLITQQPASVVVVAGQSASFSVGVNGELPFSYQWQFDGTNIAGATNRIYTIASVQPVNAGSYDVIVHNPVGTQVSQSATLYVGPAALLTALPYNNGVFTFTVNGAPGYLYIIQGSTNLMVWFPIETNTAPFTFTNNSGCPYEFYRAVFQQ